jgi:FKBP-type peptidyl-prolyl cis-trans isomerase
MSKSTIIALCVAGLILIPTLTAIIAMQTSSSPATAANKKDFTEADEKKEPDKKDAEGITTTSSGLKYKDLKVGDGTEAKKGDSVEVHYTGTFTNGKKFDSSLDRNEPFPFTIGVSRVIKGWHEGLVGMKVGGKRKLIIPYQLAYGEEGRPPTIPAKTDLIFEVELLKVK